MQSSSENNKVWDRLHREVTVSNLCKTPDWITFSSDINDDLDIALNSTYDHEKDFDVGKTEVVKRRCNAYSCPSIKKVETIKESENHSKDQIQKRKKDQTRFDEQFFYNYLHRTADDPHLKVSGRGFSRKPDGSFFKTSKFDKNYIVTDKVSKNINKK